jgi:ATP-dependent Clp protease ATP-binding subunit ClpA
VVIDRLKSKGINFEIEDGALSYLAKEGHDPHFGARPLNRLIQNRILNSVASYIISNKVSRGDTIYVSVKNNELVIETKKRKNHHRLWRGPAESGKSPIRVRAHSSV